LSFLDRVFMGDAVEVMRTLPSESIDLVVTSPPYWGLRSYGESTVRVWGGDAECKHEWHEHRKYDICFKCGAWRGQLGLEPHPSLYISHIVEVMRECRRVLKRTGSLWLNLGDTYHGGQRKNNKRQTINRERTSFWEETDSYPNRNLPDNGKWLQPKQKLLIPARVAVAMQDDGWILRNEVVWHKPSSLPESVKDRLTETWESIFFFVKNRRYYFDLDAIRKPHNEGSKKRAIRGASGSRFEAAKDAFIGEPHHAWERRNHIGYDRMEEKIAAGKTKLNPLGKNPGDLIQTRGSEEFNLAYVGSPQLDSLPNNMRTDPTRSGHGTHEGGKNPGDYWSITTQPFRGAHFATFPEKLVEPIIKAASPVEGIVLDPFCGSGTTLLVAKKLRRHYIGIDLNPNYVEMSRQRVATVPDRIEKYLERRVDPI